VTIGPAASSSSRCSSRSRRARNERRRAAASERLTPPPPVPHTLEDIGLPAERVEHLLIKTLFSAS
jgi:hypothetical protein